MTAARWRCRRHPRVQLLFGVPASLARVSAPTGGVENSTLGPPRPAGAAPGLPGPGVLVKRCHAKTCPRQLLLRHPRRLPGRRHRLPARACDCTCARRAPGVKATEIKQPPGFARDAFKPPATPIEGEPVDQQLLLPLLPDQIDGYVAEAPATARRVNVPNGGALTTAKRSYKKGSSSLELEIIDSLHSPTSGLS